MLLISRLQGKSLLDLGWNADGKELDRYISLILEGVDCLQSYTSALASTGIPLAQVSISDELRMMHQRGGPWFLEREFASAFEQAVQIAEAEDTPLSFSSGDCNPGNFLSDGSRLTGMVDFALACFEDPHIGFAKYWTYDWHPFNKAGLVSRYCAKAGVSEEVFALRMVTRSLWTLARGVPVIGHDAEFGDYRKRLLGLVRDSVKTLGGSERAGDLDAQTER